MPGFAHSDTSPIASDVPPLRLHKGTGQAYVLLNGKRRYLGRHDLPETRHRYDRLIVEWIGAGRELPVEKDQILVVEMIARFWAHAEIYYRRPDGTPTSSIENYRMALRPLRRLYADTPATEFGPKSLKAVRDLMISNGWCRKVVNQMTNLVRGVFRWAAAEELIPAEVYTALQTVSPLKKGRSNAHETEDKTPVPVADVDAIRPYVSRQVWALVQLQMTTGARGGELVGLRLIDLRMSDDLWQVNLKQHKTSHHGKTREIFIGCRGQAVITPFLTDRPVDAYLFSPREAEAERALRAQTHRRADQKPGKRKTGRTLGDCYTSDSYRRAIERGCRKAGVPHWTPHRLRHNVGTAVRNGFGLDAAQVVLGHANANVTQIYAEADRTKAMEIARQIG